MIGGFEDSLNLASKWSAKKLWNGVQIYSSFQRSRLTGKPAISGLPISVSIEPTTSCNLRCPECPSGLRSFTRPTGMLSASLFRRTIDALSPTLTYLTFYFQGEPYLHPNFLDMVEYASSKKIYTATSTNGHFLKPDQARHTVASGLDRLIISMDGTTQETYESYRIGGDLEKVIDGARNMVAAKRELKSKSPHIVFQFLVVRPNEHQIADVYRLAKEIGVDQVVLKSAQIYDYKNGSPLIPSISEYARYEKNKDGQYQIKNELLNHCWKMWHSCVITWDGKVLPCCFDKDGKYEMGDLQKESFEQIWYGKPYQRFREQLLISRSEIEICKNCTEGTRVWV